MKSLQPLLSVVIANKDYGCFIGEAIESVISQINDAGEGAVELIICDAASTDNSVEVIKRYEKYITWWCSEKDRGQSNAFNKGFSHAKGKFLTWLNADDVMLPGVVKALKKATEKNPNQEWFVGGSLLTDPNCNIVECQRARVFSFLRAKCARVLVWSPSSFFSKRLYDAVGGVDEDFHYAMDIELWCKFYFKAGVKYKPFIPYAYVLRMHPDAKMTGHLFKGSACAKATHPKWEQIRWELNEIDSRYAKDKFTFCARIFSIPLFNRLMSLLDQFKYHKKNYKKVFV